MTKISAPVLTNEQALKVIHFICPHYKTVAIKVIHCGEFDAKGWKHADSVQTIDFIGHHGEERIVIWKDDIKYYYGSTAKVASGVFSAYKYLHALNFIP